MFLGVLTFKYLQNIQEYKPQYKSIIKGSIFNIPLKQ